MALREMRENIYCAKTSTFTVYQWDSTMYKRLCTIPFQPIFPINDPHFREVLSFFDPLPLTSGK